MNGTDASARRLARALGAQTVPARLDALGVATGSPESALLAALTTLDRTDPRAVWTMLSVLLGELPGAATTRDFGRWATLDGAAAALTRVALATRRPGRRRPVPVVLDGSRILLSTSGPRSDVPPGVIIAAWSRDHRTLISDGTPILPVQSTIVVTGIADDAAAADRLGTAAEASGNRFVAPAVGTAPLANEPGAPATAATWATHLACVAHFQALVAADDAVAEDARGWASMLPGLGIVPPVITVAPAGSLESLFSA